MPHSDLRQIIGGKKVWVYDHIVSWTQVDCPDSAENEHPDTPCYETQAQYNCYNSHGKLVGTKIAGDPS